MSSTSHITARFAAEVAERLDAAGVSAFVDGEVGVASICLELVPDRELAWVDLQDPTHAIASDRDGVLRLIVNGPLGAGVEACDDAHCVAGGVVWWVVQQRALPPAPHEPSRTQHERAGAVAAPIEAEEQGSAKRSAPTLRKVPPGA